MPESSQQPESPVTIAVIDYGMGNLRSVCRALEHEGASARIVAGPEGLRGAHGVVFPGQGALGDCVAGLETSGMAGALREWIRGGRPYLGVCLGLQALFEYSEEGETRGLGIFGGRVLRFRLPSGYKIPHMGWNEARFRQPECPLTRGLRSSGESFYFVHSYYVVPEDPSLVLSETDYGGWFVSGIARGRCFATQFHPEKSQSRGLRLYRNFIETVSENLHVVE